MLIAAMLFVASACAAHRELAKPEPAPSKGPNTPSASAVPLGTAPSAAVPAPSAAPATAATQSAPAASTAASSSGANQELVKEGYRATKKRGQLMYCRPEVVTGTRFRNNVCLTEAQIMEQRRNARDTLNAPRKAVCVGGCGS
jgi:hypothetical protein